MDASIEQTRAWLRDVLVRTGLSPNALANRIGKSPTTLTRFLNDPKAHHELRLDTVRRIVEATGVQPPLATAGEAGPPSHRAEVDGLALKVETGDLRVDDAVRYLCAADANLSPWRLNTRAVELMGYLPGDIVIVDLAASPQDGDVVVAQIYNARGADTVFRLYAKPYLMAAANDRISRAPMLVDDKAVAIRGVAVAMFRPRRGHLHAA
jgi:hypothetical protein